MDHSLNFSIQNYFHNKHVQLIPIEREDIPLITGWINDERISAFNEPRFPISTVEEYIWFYKLQKDSTKKKLIICNSKSQKVGLVSLHNIDLKNRNAELGVYIDPQHQKKMYAKESLRCMIRFAFFELNLHKLYVVILDFNKPSVALFESLGFMHECTRKEYVYTNAKFFDQHWYSLSMKDFK